ncbi:hypothetical protein GAY28_13840 [Azospirillum brasilense]|nr:hypothetical protein [Azospirillum brasilense]
MFDTPDRAKKRAYVLERALKKHGVTIKHHDCLHAIATSGGYRDWHHLVAQCKKGQLHDVDDPQFQSRLSTILAGSMPSDQVRSVMSMLCGSRYIRQMILHPAITLPQGAGIPSLGVLLGYPTSQSVLDDINERLGSPSYFGSDKDPFADSYRRFAKTVIVPSQKANAAVAKHMQERQGRIDQKIVQVKKKEKGVRTTKG